MNFFATDPGLLGVSCTPEVAARLRVAPETLRFWRWKSVGPASFPVGGRVVYCESVVADWVDAQARAAPER